MARLSRLNHDFVRSVPENLATGVLYVSMEFASAVHLCCCGCGHEVVTPLSPSDWKLTYDGESISLHPSIGNWSFPCRSHYWIRGSRVEWAEDMDDYDVQAGRNQGQWNSRRNSKTESRKRKAAKKAETKRSLWSRFWKPFD